MQAILAELSSIMSLRWADICVINEAWPNHDNLRGAIHVPLSH